MIQPGTTQAPNWASASGVLPFMMLYDAAFLSVGALTVLQAMPTVASPLARRADSGRPRHASP